jgi:hypothetical protein
MDIDAIALNASCDQIDYEVADFDCSNSRDEVGRLQQRL